MVWYETPCFGFWKSPNYLVFEYIPSQLFEYIWIPNYHLLTSVQIPHFLKPDNLVAKLDVKTYEISFRRKMCVEISFTRIRFQVFPVVAERPSLLTSNSTEHINGQNILSWDKNMDFPCNKLKKIGDAKGNTQGFLSINRIRECEIGSSNFGSIILN